MADSMIPMHRHDDRIGTMTTSLIVA